MIISSLRFPAILMMLACFALLSSPQVAQAKKARGDVYLLRGFGNVFSRGLDEIGRKLNKSGIEAKVIGHTEWQTAVDSIIKNRKRFGRRPVILIGHSLGANAVIRIANELKRKRIRVNYMVTFAATNPEPVPANVNKVTNYYFATDGWGKPLKKGPGFRGRLRNIDFSRDKKIGHFNIDKQQRLQRQVISNTRKYLRYAGS